MMESRSTAPVSRRVLRPVYVSPGIVLESLTLASKDAGFGLKPFVSRLFSALSQWLVELQSVS